MTLLPRVLLSVFIALFLYCQIFLLASVLAWRLPNGYVSLECNKGNNANLHIALPFLRGACVFPMPEVLFLLFNGGGVFDAKATFNLDPEIQAQLKGTPIDGQWIELKGIERYFPGCSRAQLWERLTMEWQKTLGAQLRLLPADAERQSYRSLSQKFIRRWNNDHPQQQIGRIAIYLIWWPRSDRSYFQFSDQKQYQLIYRDPYGR
jgi:hypothetical protein